MITKNQVKYIQSLGQKKSRDADNVFIAEGPKLVRELLNASNCNVKQVFALKDWIDQIPGAIKEAEIIEVSVDELKKISQLQTPNQVLAIVEKITWPQELVLKENVSLLLDGIQDPGNMGTIVRLTDWFGLKNIICSLNCADIYNPKVIQASMGSIARVRVIYVKIDEWLTLLTANSDILIYAAVLDGSDVTKMEKIKEGIIVIGNESKGISDEILELSNVQITIPKKGKAESLNAAVATGIILSHLV
jgi:RNA methyltransferase, TrmH family